MFVWLSYRQMCSGSFVTHIGQWLHVLPLPTQMSSYVSTGGCCWSFVMLVLFCDYSLHVGMTGRRCMELNNNSIHYFTSKWLDDTAGYRGRLDTVWDNWVLFVLSCLWRALLCILLLGYSVIIIGLVIKYQAQDMHCSIIYRFLASGPKTSASDSCIH